MCYVLQTCVSFFIGLNAVDIKTEADSSDVTECSLDHKPVMATGMFDLSGIQGGPKKTGPPCYIASNFRNTAQIYTIFCRNQSRFISNTKT